MPGPTGAESVRDRRTWWWVAGLALVLVAAIGTVAWLLDGREDDQVAGVEPTPTAVVEPAPSPSAQDQPTGVSSPDPTPLTPAPGPQPAEPQPEAEPESQVLTGATYGPFSGSPDDLGRNGSWIADVRSAGHVGYDRVAVEFDGDYVPIYQVGYTLTPGPFYDIPGEVVTVEGTAFLHVWLQGTSRVDMTNDYEPVYTGPDRVRSDTVVVTEAVELEDFEANVRWIIGLDTKTPFVVWTLDSPSRLVIDIAH